MPQATPPNDRQLEVLRWISEGCPERLWPDDSHKHSARALMNRGLAKVSRKAGVWTATITDAGSHYLEHGRYPQGYALPPLPKRHSQDRGTENTPSLELSDGATETLAQARELIERLQQEPGKISITDPEESTRGHYRRLLHACRVHHLVPAGHELRFTGRNSGDIVIMLSSGSPDDVTDWDRIRTTARKITTNAGALRDALERSAILDSVSEDLRPKAVAFLLDLAEHLRKLELRLGANVKLKTPKLFVQIDTRRRDLTLTEIVDNVPHVPTAAEEREARRFSWKTPPPFDQVPSGRLRLSVARDGWSPNHNKRNGDEWSDEKKQPLERRTSEIARAIKQGVVDDDDAQAREQQRQAEAREAWRREQAEERRVWQELRDGARVKAITERREATFMDSFDAWRGAQELRAFADQLEASASAQGQLEERPRLREWLEWARARADEIDPIANLKRLDDAVFDIEPTADDLRPHMKGWDPSAPHKDYSANYDNRPPQQVRTPRPQPWHPGMRGKPSWWRH